MSEEVFVPLIDGVRMGVSFFEEAPEPMIVISFVGHDADGDVTTSYGAFAPQHLQGLIPEIVDAVIRAQTIMEMVTTWPEQREEILKNLAFRWTGSFDTSEDEGNGE